MTKQEFCKNPNLEISDHFDGRCFSNPNGPEKHSFFSFLKWMTNRKAQPWPKKREIVQKKITEKRVSDGCHLTFINHSTVLLQWGGWNILTDPIWSERCGPFGILGPKRVHAPGVRFDDLPPIDLVLLSHNHYDHLDLPTLKRLNQEHHPQFLTGLGNKQLLKNAGISSVTELDWWQEMSPKQDLKVAFVPAIHFSARTVFDRNRTLWGGFVLSNSSGIVYFAGDTGYGPHFKQIRDRFGSPNLALLPIGAYEPRWFMEPIHLSPLDALQAHEDLKAGKSMGIHFGTFRLTDEGIDAPIEELKLGLQKKGISSDTFFTLKPGEVCLLEL